MPKDWREVRASELESSRDRYEEAKRIAESDDYRKSQAAFFAEIVNEVRAWNLTSEDALRIMSVIHYLTKKIIEPLEVIEEYERKRKTYNDIDPNAN